MLLNLRESALQVFVWEAARQVLWWGEFRWGQILLAGGKVSAWMSARRRLSVK